MVFCEMNQSDFSGNDLNECGRNDVTWLDSSGTLSESWTKFQYIARGPCKGHFAQESNEPLNSDAKPVFRFLGFHSFSFQHGCHRVPQRSRCSGQLSSYSYACLPVSSPIFRSVFLWHADLLSSPAVTALQLGRLFHKFFYGKHQRQARTLARTFFCKRVLIETGLRCHRVRASL
jgi:hypothetical protein